MNKSRTVVLGFALVAASSIWVWRWIRRDSLTPVIAAAAELSNRTIEARLCGFDYRARPVRERGAGAAGGFRLHASALAVLNTTESSDKPSDLYAAGVAALLAGDASAIDRLRSAAAASPSDARYQNDLAAGLHIRARSEGDAGELVDALAAADQKREPWHGPPVHSVSFRATDATHIAERATDKEDLMRVVNMMGDTDVETRRHYFNFEYEDDDALLDSRELPV